MQHAMEYLLQASNHSSNQTVVLQPIVSNQWLNNKILEAAKFA